jgi:hypothetical protein
MKVVLRFYQPDALDADHFRRLGPLASAHVHLGVIDAERLESPDRRHGSGCEEVADGCRDLRGVRFQREVSGIEEPHDRIRNIVFERLGARVLALYLLSHRVTGDGHDRLKTFEGIYD